MNLNTETEFDKSQLAIEMTLHLMIFNFEATFYVCSRTSIVSLPTGISEFMSLLNQKYHRPGLSLI